MSVAQTQAQRSREMYLAVDTGLSPHTLTLSTLGPIAEDAYHVRQPDAYQNKQGDVLSDGHRSLPAHI